MSDWKTGFLCLMTRPWEPLFYPRYGGKTYMSLPESYFSDRYRPIAGSIADRFGSTTPYHVNVKQTELPDLSYAEAVPRHAFYNLFSTAQRRIAGKLVEDFMKQPDPETLLSVASYARDRLNPTLFQYALSVTLLHRKDTGQVSMPSLLELFPQRFIDPLALPKLREEGFIVDLPQRMAIEIPMNFTASEAELEQRVAYFREDIGVNLHHWHWHLVYPMDGPLEVVRKDRRGELFYYMHRQMVARYSAERYCNFLPPIQPLNNFRMPIGEAYFPKILNSALNRTFSSRPKDFVPSHVNRPADDAVGTILEVETWLRRYFEAVDSGAVLLPNGERLTLDETTGIDIIGNLLENTILSVNIPHYGNIHSLLHVIIAYIHDPDNVYLEGPAPMGDTATAMRDPVFYRLHLFVDDLLEHYKRKLIPYSMQELGFPGITIRDVSVQISTGKAAVNRLLTYWQRSQVDLGVGLDFGPQGSVLATFTHLQHAPFVYRINVVNDMQKNRRGTIRIFLAPIYQGFGEPLTFDKQRRSVIELDKFTVNLIPGMNNITRRSDESSVTIPFERSFQRKDVAFFPGTERQQFCNCGWPDHMLLPKGNAEGVPYDLFVMVSDYKNDTVNQKFDETDCNDSHSYCGLRDRLYPDRRAMGFPFDRTVPKDVLHMEDFTKQFSNMKRTVVEVRFTNTVISKT
ncbi:phenoloxidase 8-like [Culex pipiens pallens]|uniref:phenoloxidase 8-like n=1 Tax=Culex pipiens pallens TaxID=42434 RepID=UPI0019546BC8|nr:phenoloxidase 8-like [Culex pipiens pallens]